jgi:hypothetical protein
MPPGTARGLDVHSLERTFYRRSGISPCPEGLLFWQRTQSANMAHLFTVLCSSINIPLSASFFKGHPKNSRAERKRPYFDAPLPPAQESDARENFRPQSIGRTRASASKEKGTLLITSKRLARAAQSTIVLPFLLAALLGLGFGFHATPISHTTSSASSHLLAVEDPPPGH